MKRRAFERWLDATHGHSTHTWAAVWERELRDFLAHNAPSVPRP